MKNNALIVHLCFNNPDTKMINRWLKFGLMLTLFVALGCSRGGNPPQVVFGVSPNPAKVGRPAQFTNQTLDATTFEWFVQGNLVSNEREFEYIFEDAGIFTVILRAVGPGGEASERLQVTVNDPRDRMEGLYRGTMVTSVGGSRATENGVLVQILKGLGPLDVILDMAGTNAVPPRIGVVNEGDGLTLDYRVAGFRFSGIASVNGNNMNLQYSAFRLSDGALAASYVFNGSRTR
jgi:hypothetical protein